MYNWLGQEVKLGSVVGRGARIGNGSEFKIGVVTELFEDEQKVRVEWKYTSDFSREELPDGTYADGRTKFKWGDDHGYYPGKGWGTTPEGTKGAKVIVESIFVLDDSVLEKAERFANLAAEVRERQWKQEIPVSQQEWLDRVAQL